MPHGNLLVGFIILTQGILIKYFDNATQDILVMAMPVLMVLPNTLVSKASELLLTCISGSMLNLMQMGEKSQYYTIIRFSLVQLFVVFTYHVNSTNDAEKYSSTTCSM